MSDKQREGKFPEIQIWRVDIIFISDTHQNGKFQEILYYGCVVLPWHFKKKIFTFWSVKIFLLKIAFFIEKIDQKNFSF